MKKLAFILVAGAMLFSSCKKDYTCTCVPTVNASNFTSGYVVVVPSASKGEAATICKANESYDPTNGAQQLKCTL